MSRGPRLQRFTLFRQFLFFKNHKNIEKWQKSPTPGPEDCMCLYQMVGKAPCGV